MLWSAAAIFSIVGGLLIYALVRVQQHSAGNAGPREGYQNSIVLEIIWAFIPVAILIALLLLTNQAIPK
jgi:heme/copper-type cytochrome/quinol oxidase subunit 2